MKIIFNDATELAVQKVYTDASGALRIKTISATQEELKMIFSDATKTKKMIVQELEQTKAEYINYTQFDGIMAYTAGILEPVLYKAGESPEEVLAKIQADNETLTEDNEELKTKVEMLTQCVLEMSEMVYQ